MAPAQFVIFIRGPSVRQSRGRPPPTIRWICGESRGWLEWLSGLALAGPADSAAPWRLEGAASRHPDRMSGVPPGHGEANRNRQR